MRKAQKPVGLISLSALLVLLSLVFFSAAAARLRIERHQTNLNQSDAEKGLIQRRKEIDARVPTTDYDSPEPTDLEQKAKRWKKNKHYDGANFVMKNPSDEGSSTVIDSHAFFELPALPVAASNVILTADVLNSEAHLSNDKTGVYSEFNVQVKEVFKNTVSTLSQNAFIILSRRGGKVRYASRHVERYEIMNQNMPAAGKRYLFFLKAIPDSDDYEILTGYEIGSEHVQPLDFGQFEVFRGKDVGGFIDTVRNAIEKTNAEGEKTL